MGEGGVVQLSQWGCVTSSSAYDPKKNVSNQIIVEQNVLQSFSSLCTNTICELVNNILQQIMIQKCVIYMLSDKFC